MEEFSYPVWIKKYLERESLSSVDQDIKEKFEQEKLMRKYVVDNIDFLVLASLSKDKKHGYGIKKDIYKTFDVILSSSDIYPSLKSLVERGLLEFEGWENLESGKPKKVYRITDEGERFRETYTKGLLRVGSYITNSYVELKIEKMLEEAGIDIDRVNE